MMPGFRITKVSDEIGLDLQKKILASPALAPYIVAQIAGQVNIMVAVPGILSGVHGFAPDTGRTKRDGLFAVFRNLRTGFTARLWTPLFNIFAPGTKRGIKPINLWDGFDSATEAIADSVIRKALNDYDENRLPDLDKYLLLGTRRGGRRNNSVKKIGASVPGVFGFADNWGRR